MELVQLVPFVVAFAEVELRRVHANALDSHKVYLAQAELA